MGFMSVSTNVNTTVLSENFELEVFNHFIQTIEKTKESMIKFFVSLLPGFNPNIQFQIGKNCFRQVALVSEILIVSLIKTSSFFKL